MPREAFQTPLGSVNNKASTPLRSANKSPQTSVISTYSRNNVPQFGS
jgi:hypothetical protein